MLSRSNPSDPRCSSAPYRESQLLRPVAEKARLQTHSGFEVEKDAPERSRDTECWIVTKGKQKR